MKGFILGVFLQVSLQFSFCGLVGKKKKQPQITDFLKNKRQLVNFFEKGEKGCKGTECFQNYKLVTKVIYSKI